MDYELVQETWLQGRTFSGEHCDCGSDDWKEWRDTMIHSGSE